MDAKLADGPGGDGGGGDGGAGDGGGGGDGGAADARFDAAPIWATVALLPGLDLSDSSQAAGFRTDDIYFARERDPMWMKSWNLGTGLVSDRTTQADLCACGYGGTLVAYEGDGSLYHFGNDGMRYSVSGDSWTPVSYPTDYQRGEAATAVHGGAIWFVGGRDTPTGSQTYDPDSGAWMALGVADYPWLMDSGGAASLDRALYVVGGDSTERHAAVLPDGANSWTILPDLPFDAHRPSAVAVNGRILVADSSGGGLALYDPGAGAWSSRPLPPGAGTQQKLVRLADRAFLLFQHGADVEIAEYIGPY